MKKTSKPTPEEVKGDKDAANLLKLKEREARANRLNEKFNKALQEEQFDLRIINKCNPDTLEVLPTIQLVDKKYGDKA